VCGKVTGCFPCTEPLNLWKLVYLSDYILQQSTFFRADVVRQLGFLDENSHYAMDWDIFVHVARLRPLEHIPEYLGCIREYSEAKSPAGGAVRVKEIPAPFRKVSLAFSRQRQPHTAVSVVCMDLASVYRSLVELNRAGSKNRDLLSHAPSPAPPRSAGSPGRPSGAGNPLPFQAATLLPPAEEAPQQPLVPTPGPPLPARRLPTAAGRPAAAGTARRNRLNCAGVARGHGINIDVFYQAVSRCGRTVLPWRIEREASLRVATGTARGSRASGWGCAFPVW
jgi:hypothetical protein